jgi:TRAP transporter 4TM/12TM fusion protein
MAATAFVMASILGVPYVDVAIAAAVPIMLYFFCLFLQLDAYAAKHHLRGVPPEELPSLLDTFRKGWFYLFAFAVLVFLLIVLRREVVAPYWATAVLVILAMVRPETRWTWKRAGELITATGRLLSEIVAILAAVGFLIGSLSVTGLAGTISSDLVVAAGESVLLLLVLGAVACFILGMGMTITAAYIFLAITMAPALVGQGMDAMAVHLFILYWAALSNVTPPVGLAVIAASGVAGSRLMPAMWESVRFVTVKFALPFFFVYSPVLVLQGFTWPLFLQVITVAIVGAAALAYALQGYLPWIGPMRENAVAVIVRALMVVGALMLMFPEFITTVIGMSMVSGLYALAAVAGQKTWFPLVRGEATPPARS